MIAKKYSIITLIFLLTSCGFKVIDYSKLNNFKIESIQTNGENSINYRLKNKIKVISNEQSNNLVKLTIFSRKINNIKEKNIKNEITKYELEIIITFDNFGIYRPQIHENNGSTKLMFPQDARLRNFTYASNMTIDMNIKYIIRTLFFIINQFS